MRSRSLHRSVLGILPTFVVLSIIGCLIGRFAFGIEHGLLGLVVSVPLVVGFLFTRFMISFVPHTASQKARPKPRRVDVVLLATILALGVTGIVMLISSGPYWAIGLPAVAIGSLRLGGWLLSCGLVLLVIEILLFVSTETKLSVPEIVYILGVRFARVFWSALYFEMEWSRSRFVGAER